MAGYQMNYNQDFSSICVVGGSEGFRLFSIGATNKVEEIFSKDNEHIRVVERLFNSSLVVLVTVDKPNCLRMLHYKKKQEICNCVYPSEILCIRMNRQRLIVCLAESIHIHDIRDMKILHSIGNIAPNDLGLCSLSLNSYLAFPVCSTSGRLSIFAVNKLKPGITIQAHDSVLSALCFSPNGTLLATASERGTVIRVFCVKNGQRVQEFRRGVKRCVRIASLVFSTNGEFLCASSNTETVHIFKIDPKAVEAAGRKPLISADDSINTEQIATPASVTASTESGTKTKLSIVPKNEEVSSSGGWSGYLSKAVSSYLIPSQVSDVLSQDRAFATAVLGQPGLKYACGIARIQKELHLLVACEDGFLYIYHFNAERGGQCKLLQVHDLRSPLEGIVELNLTESSDKTPSTPIASSSKVLPMASTSKSTNKVAKTCAASILIQNPDPAPDNSYAGILKGDKAVNTLTDSAKFRKLCDAIDTPSKLYDERQFPPVAIAAKD